MNLNIVIVNWNSGPLLARLLHSLRPLANETRGVVVIDNGSEDWNQESWPQLPGLRWFRHDSNRGFAAAANHGISFSETDFVLLLNPDLELNADAVHKLYAVALQNPRCAVACGPLRDSRGRPQGKFQVRRFPSLWSILSDVLFLDELRNLFGKADGRRDFEQEAVREVEQPAAAYWLLRKEAWQSVGGFDEAFYPAWFEDVDFCKRLHNAGWKILYVSAPAVLHHGGSSLKKLGYRQFTRIYYANLLRYVQKHHPFCYPWLWLPVQLGVWARLTFYRKCSLFW
ncbi:MAG: glycosyltransferase family 2 protein [Acidobacteria bacterium]|nr:glycosyltransferase family 2 protein [Acidobacteriota bacterium]